MPAVPVGNGEHAAELAAKAKAKADADTLKARKAEGEKALKALVAGVKRAATGWRNADAKADELHHTLGREILAVDAVLVQYPDLGLSIARWCETEIPEVSGPVFGSSPAYRALSAARVIEQAPDFAYLKVDAARAAHRVRDTRGAVPKVLKAAAKAAKGGTVTAALVADAMQDLYPKAEGNTPGPAKGSAKAANGAKAKAAKSRNTPTEPTEKPDLAVSGTRLKAAAQRADTLFANVSPEHFATAYAIAETVLRSCEDYGTAATRIALVAKAPKAPAKAAKAPAKARTTRTTRKATRK